MLQNKNDNLKIANPINIYVTNKVFKLRVVHIIWKTVRSLVEQKSHFPKNVLLLHLNGGLRCKILANGLRIAVHDK